MDNNSIGKKVVKAIKYHSKRSTKARAPRSLSLVSKGLRSSNDLALVFCAVMADVIESRMTSSQGNAVSNIGGKLLKTKEMEFKHGRIDPKTQQKVFLLTA